MHRPTLMGLTATLDTVLRGKKKGRVVRTLRHVLGATLVLDAIALVLLREVPAWTTSRPPAAVSWSWPALLHGLGDYTGDTVDCLVIYLVRVALLLSLGYAACRVTASAPSEQSTSSVAPLLINGEAPGGGRQPRSEIQEAHRIQHERSRSAEHRRNLIIGLLFLVSTVVQAAPDLH